MARQRVLIIGAGIVGLATAQALIARGHPVTVLDPDPEGDRASWGNAGGIALPEIIPASAPGVFFKVPGWLMDPLGPLSLRPMHLPGMIPWLWHFSRVASRHRMERIAAALAELHRHAEADLTAMLAAEGLQDRMTRSGALYVYESAKGSAAEAADWTLRRTHGFDHTTLTGDQAREIEPALGPIVTHAVLTPDWLQIADPKALHLDLLAGLRAKGLQVLRRTATRILTEATGLAVETTEGPVVADQVVLAAGAWSAALAATLGDRVLLESERGYNTTLTAPGIRIGREIVFSERKFVASPHAMGLRIGGAAEFGGLHARPDFRRSEALLRLARSYFPGLSADPGTPWAGHRPTTPDSLPVIGRSSHAPRVIHAFGHGHLGLTQAATTARLVADLIEGAQPSLPLAPFSLDRF